MKSCSTATTLQRLSLLLLSFGVSSVQGLKFCEAVDGVYWERPNDPGAQESPASVQVTYHYDLELSDALQATPPDNAAVAETLQHRIADALVFTLFDDCRVDEHDKLAEVNLLSIAVTVDKLPQDNSSFEAHIRATADSAVGDNEMILADQRLENAVRIVVQEHHLARFSVQPGAILTLQPPQVAAPTQGGDEDDTPSPPTTAPPSHLYPVLAAMGGCGTLVLALLLIHQRINSKDASKHVHFELPGEEDDVELACNKPSSNLLRTSCDPTETETDFSESSASGETEDW